jgi:hypothetical protein
VLQRRKDDPERIEMAPFRSRRAFWTYAVERLRLTGARYVGLAIFLAYLVPPNQAGNRRQLENQPEIVVQRRHQRDGD